MLISVIWVSHISKPVLRPPINEIVLGDQDSNKIGVQEPNANGTSVIINEKEEIDSFNFLFFKWH
jgi:hypothetical protein